MTQEDFDKIIEITDNERVWVGDEIAKEYYKDEMPEYGVFPPELYVEVLNKDCLLYTSGVFEDRANGYAIGGWRKRANRVSDIQTALPQEVPEKIQTLF